LNSERRTNSIIEKNRFFQNENRFLEKNEINIPSCTQIKTKKVPDTVIQLSSGTSRANSISEQSK